MGNDLIPIDESKETTEPGMTLSEYQNKYSSKTNAKLAKALVNIVIALIGIVIVVLLFLFCKQAYEWNEYVGYVAIGGSVLVFIFFFIVPVVKIKTMPAFKVDVNVYNGIAAKRHNAKVRNQLADSIIDLFVSAKGSANLYPGEKVKALMRARKDNDKEALKKALDDLYANDIKNTAKGIIIKAAVRSGVLSAVSQQNTTDALIVTLFNLQMVKDIIFLYGFRPSDARLVKILAEILVDALLAYGIGSINIGNTIVKTIGGVAESIPILGSLISTLVDSGIQGLSNGVLTAVIGRFTLSYLNKEYHLQSILDNVVVTESDEEFAASCDEVKREIIAQKKAKKAH